jgi:hypothetical protein
MGCDYYKINMLEIYKDDELIGYTEWSRKRCYFKPCSIDSDSDVEIDYDKYYEEKLDKVPLNEDKVLFINNQWTSPFIKNKYIFDVLYHLIGSNYVKDVKDADLDVLFNSLNISKIIKTQHTVMN